MSLINLLFTTLFRGCTVQDVRIQYSEDYPTQFTMINMMLTGILFIYMLTSCGSAEIAWRGGDPIQCGLYLLSNDYLDGDSNVLIIVNVKYNYLSIESSCLGWQVCEIKLLTLAN
jgi:hypothetical protein